MKWALHPFELRYAQRNQNEIERIEPEIAFEVTRCLDLFGRHVEVPRDRIPDDDIKRVRHARVRCNATPRAFNVVGICDLRDPFLIRISTKTNESRSGASPLSAPALEIP
jgi:hypothetical protein